MTIDDFERYIAASVSRYRRSDNAIAVEGDLNLPHLTTLPEGVTLTAGGGLNLGGEGALYTLDDGQQFTLSAEEVETVSPIKWKVSK